MRDCSVNDNKLLLPTLQNVKLDSREVDEGRRTARLYTCGFASDSEPTYLKKGSEPRVNAREAMSTDEWPSF